MLEKKVSTNFLEKHESIREGDIVFVVVSSKKMFSLKVKPGETFTTKYGCIKHSDLIGRKYGSKFVLPRGWIYLLAFNPELWTANLPHRTQILYTVDISLILFKLNLKPGCVVIEAGTGSGSLSHAFIRTISPNGLLYSYDFHQDRLIKADEEFSDHGVSHLVKTGHRDVCEQGFGLDHAADALFLDIPYPWKAIAFARDALKPQGARLCCFSPCIEQVQKTRLALEENCFIDIETIECLQRPYQVKNIPLKEYDFEPTAPSHPSKEEKKSLDAIHDEEVDQMQNMDSDKGPSSPLQSQPIASSDSIKSSSHLKVVPQIQITGHTGFLTFAFKI
ncbi:tRNA methyltransferase 61 [Brevipalpus obovatus]|uniref:tRNA methyltransferase 61 n=1 Tax=Brevipalpus obovatus TaxID=246614 RepID=UPI003D9DDB6C